jgi:hypothetical protein
MSRLSVFWPEESDSVSVATDDPMILPFPKNRRPSETAARSSDVIDMDVVTRARVLFANRTCRSCGYPVVEPIELSDSAMNLSGLAIPGTATLVGFRCCGCDAEWSI